MRLDEAVCLVTDPGGAIGAAVAAEVERAGARVVGVDDLWSAAGRARLATLDGVTHAVFTGAPSVALPLAEVTEADWDRAVTVGPVAAFELLRALCPRLPAGGAVVTVVSVAGKSARNPEVTVYSAAEAAVLSLTRSFANAYAAAGVRVNAVCTGVIGTPANDAYLREVAAGRGVGVAELTATRLGAVPMGRTGTLAEVASTVRFLLSADAGFVTGQSINVTGGFQQQ
ncbi:SDR family oxidoreductase [Polymorphospora sp. NPDC051019]|uniref:SDR family NAD(P)-dependent oxidoreductase n=1 Tax=Polymorphospora sp. NPDC051019 TaxID=3155725 RepID=UPI0034462CE8